MAAPAPVAYSWDDFVALDDDDKRELVDGQLLEVEVPNGIHEHIVVVLAFYLHGWARAHGGVVLASGYKVRITDRRGVMPDVQFFGPESARKLPHVALTEGHPDLAVEIHSPSSRSFDRVTKLAWYASIRTPEYWIVDPESRTIERLLLGPDGRYVIADALRDDATFTPASFAGLSIPLAELWTLPG